MKKVKIIIDQAPVKEFTAVPIEEEDFDRIMEAYEENDSDALFDYYEEKDNECETLYGPIYFEGNAFVTIDVNDENVFSDYIDIGNEIKLTDIFYTEDLAEDEDYYNIERNGFHVYHDDNNIFDISEDMDNVIIRMGMPKAGLNFEFEINDDEVFDINKLSFIVDTEENDILGDDKIDAFHLLYDNKIIEGTDYENGGDKDVKFYVGSITTYGDIYLK